MQLELTEEQRLIVQGVRETMKPYGLEYWRRKDQAHEFATEAWQALGRGGWVGIKIPEEYGGAGKGTLELTLVCEEACRAGGGAAQSNPFVSTPDCGAEAVLRYGSEAMRREYLPQIAAGKLDFCIALTEPNAGSNSLAIETRAVRDGDVYRINGQKIWISGIQQAQKALVVTRTTPLAEAPKKSYGISLFIADVPSEGLSFQPIEKMGTHTFQSNMVYFDDLRVRADHLIGQEDEGWKALLDVLNTERMLIAAGCVATADIALGIAARYAGERKVFGRPIGANQGIQFPLADLKIRTDAARLLNYKAAWLSDQGLPCGAEANMAFYLAADVGFFACDQAIQTLGGYGYAVDSDLERLWRDTRLSRLAPISQQMILNYVGQHVLGMPRSY